MSVLGLSDYDELVKVIDTKPLVVVNFSRRHGCVWCDRLAPHYERAAEQDNNVLWAKVFLDETPDMEAMIEEFALQATPTMKLFRNGEYVKDLGARTVVPLLSEVKNA